MNTIKNKEDKEIKNFINKYDPDPDITTSRKDFQKIMSFIDTETKKTNNILKSKLAFALGGIISLAIISLLTIKTPYFNNIFNSTKTNTINQNLISEINDDNDKISNQDDLFNLPTTKEDYIAQYIESLLNEAEDENNLEQEQDYI